MDRSYSSPKPEAVPGRLHPATVLPAPGTLRPPQATASQAVTTMRWSYFFFFFFASNSRAKNIKAGRRNQVCGGGDSLSLRVLSRTWHFSCWIWMCGQNQPTADDAGRGDEQVHLEAHIA